MMNKVCDVITADKSMFLAALKNMKERGEISLEQYGESLRRAKSCF